MCLELSRYTSLAFLALYVVKVALDGDVMVCPALLPQLSVPSSFAYLLCQVVSFFSPFSLFAKFIGYPQKDVHCHVVPFYEA